ncbi:Hypothetical protein MexAM1_META2p1170 (plasmid) [Methylorubrum extorquens AM1]|uniref:Uncharacterized protein n=2 Tax=Methylorubrum extorquens TaxID=408 RepID=C5B655_METEA|nr:Hypothetical protein MexAM1_META2p1170 [Methylorubrum extorquens AM1]
MRGMEIIADENPPRPKRRMDVILVERASQLIAQAAVYLAEGHDAVKDASIASELDALSMGRSR